MSYQEVYETYEKLRSALIEKKLVLKERKIEKLHLIDEDITVICEKLERLKVDKHKFDNYEKKTLKRLIKEIKEIEENNEILIKRSLDVINEMLSGILNISQSEKCSYDSKGLGHCDKESLDISSITEEA